jgi:chromosome condensin MukBEF ATPase and DNA-binding subunit MukB
MRRSRTRANALVLVNWKGVFYERYLLERYVTALEGANGAGKTTVGALDFALAGSRQLTLLR